MLLFSEGICKSQNLSPTLRLLPTDQTLLTSSLKSDRSACGGEAGYNTYYCMTATLLSLSYPLFFPCRPLHFLIYFKYT